MVFDGPVNRSLAELRSVLAPGGVHVFVGGPKGGWIQPIPVLAKMRLASVFSDFRAAGCTAVRSTEDLRLLGDWLGAGTIRSVVDRTYSLEEVPEALRYQGEFHARGEIVVST